MNRIDRAFGRLAREGRTAFIAYITAGDPDLATTAKLVPALEEAGVDIIELGIPFSDPLADGPVIQAASHRSLLKGTTLAKVFTLVERLRRKTAVPIVFMTYYNPVLAYGIAKFMKRCRAAGVDGVIIPDLPYEEAREVLALGRRERIATIFLAAPTSTRERLGRIAWHSTGFIYYVSLTGVTGARKTLPQDVVSHVRLLKRLSDKPVAVGFGISNAEQARAMAKVADGVIVGSAIVKIAGQGSRAVQKAKRFAKKIADAVHGV